jgi:flagellar hook-associated protein 2
VAEVQARIDADASLLAMNAKVKVAYNSATKALEITSDSKGDKSKVDVVSVGAGVPATLGLTARSGVPGRNASDVADKAGGLQIQVLGGALGDRGEITLVRGVMSQFNRYLSSAISFTGPLQNRVNTLEAELQEIEEEGTQFDKRMDLLETRLRTQFAAADALISKLNSTSSYLDQQLANLPGYSRKKQR